MLLGFDICFGLDEKPFILKSVLSSLTSFLFINSVVQTQKSLPNTQNKIEYIKTYQITGPTIPEFPN